MTIRIRLRWDIGALSSGLIQARAMFDHAAKNGLQHAIDRLLNDVRDLPPSCPVATRHMYDSHVTYTETKKASLAVVSTPYAAAVHEGVTSRGVITKWTRPGSGPKWIEAKLLRYQVVYASKFLDGVAIVMKSFFGQFKRAFK